jgi:hypothetical protein
MRHVWTAAFILLGAMVLPAAAQVAAYVWTPLGYQQISPTVTTPSTLTVPGGTRMAYICAETNTVRYRDDGTPPTATSGQPIFAGTCIYYSGSLAAMVFQQATSPAVLDLSYYR